MSFRVQVLQTGRSLGHRHRQGRPGLESLEGRALLSVAVGDFNGDGFADLAIGAPGEDGGAGIVHILYGSSDGLTSDHSQFWRQGSPGIGDHSESGDYFGFSLACCDFNHDGFDDLVIGAYGEDHGSGIVHILYGSSSGLTSDHRQIWSQGSHGIGDHSVRGDYFGFSLACCDFNHDGFDDLAVGAPGEDQGAGVVLVLYGSSDGLTSDHHQYWRQGSNGILGHYDSGDHFGGTDLS